MKKPADIITIFNNKGGVGKTTLTFHLAHALGELGKRVLLVDLDPQCNLTIFALPTEQIHTMWENENIFIDDFEAARILVSASKYEDLLQNVRSVHFSLKPTEDGTAELPRLTPPAEIGKNVDLLPGRLTLHLYEAKLGERWSGIYQGDPLSIRTGTRIRALAHQYAAQFNYDLIIFDTSPSLGALNRNLLSLADGFVIPCAPDLFSVYGIRNIGQALDTWRKQFDSIFHFLSDTKRSSFPKHFVKFMGYTLYNARKTSKTKNALDLATAQFNYAKMIPDAIGESIDVSNMIHASHDVLSESIGGNILIHSHNTLPNMAQKYHLPMWRLPRNPDLEAGDRSTISGNSADYDATGLAYRAFAQDFLSRVEWLHV